MTMTEPQQMTKTSLDVLVRLACSDQGDGRLVTTVLQSKGAARQRRSSDCSDLFVTEQPGSTDGPMSSANHRVVHVLELCSGVEVTRVAADLHVASVVDLQSVGGRAVRVSPSTYVRGSTQPLAANRCDHEFPVAGRFVDVSGPRPTVVHSRRRINHAPKTPRRGFLSCGHARKATSND